MRTVVVINNDQMGVGDVALGQKILGAFLRKATTLEGLQAIIFYNNGVRLVCDSSPFLPELTQLHEHGVELLPCGTCIDFYGLADRVTVSRPSNMDEIVKEMSRATKVITL